MKDYSQIITKVGSTPWLMTPEGLTMILSIIDERIKNGRIDSEEIDARLAGIGRGNGDNEFQVYRGVGIIPVHGPIFGKANMMTQLSGATSLEMFANQFEQAMADGSIHTVLLDIDSPGGTSELVEETSAMIAAAEKPVYGIANSMAGSAAYWLGSQTKQLYMTPSGAVGSVGAYTVHTDQSEADRKDGIRYTFTSAGPHKVEGNPHQPLSQDAKDFRQKVIDELYNKFVSAVAVGRKVDAEAVKANMGGGRMLPASMAIEAGMVDGITSYSNLLNTLANGKPQRVQVAIPATADVAAQTVVGFMNADGFVTLGEDVKPLLSGLLSGPSTVSKGKGDTVELNDEQYAQMCTALGLSADAPPDSFMTAAIAAITETTELKKAVQLSGEELSLKDSHPQFYAEHMKLMERTLNADAKDFADSVSSFTRMEGTTAVPTKFGLSALAKDTVEETHKKLAAEGSPFLADFENCIKTICGGFVDYGEKGSSASADLDVTQLDVSTATGSQNVRHLFAAKVAEIERDDKLEYAAAVAEAAKRYPDLAAAYRNARVSA